MNNFSIKSGSKVDKVFNFYFTLKLIFIRVLDGSQHGLEDSYRMKGRLVFAFTRIRLFVESYGLTN